MDGLITYIIILVILTLIYVRTTKISSTEKEYFVLSRSENTAGLALSFYASGMGLWILTAPAEVAWWGLGYDVIGYAVSAATPFLLLYFLGSKIAELTPDGATLPQFIQSRYGRTAQIVVSLVAIIYMSAFLIAEFASIIFLFPSISETSGIAVAVLIGLFTFAYIRKSGFKASYITDRFQGVAIIVLLFILFGVWFSENSYADIVNYSKLGGINSFETFSLRSALAVVLAVTAAEIFSQGYWQRTFSAKNSETVKKASLIAGFGAFITILLLGFAGAVGAGKGLESPTLSFIEQFELSPVLSILLIVLCTLLVASSIDTLENAISSTISLDILKKGAKEAEYTTLGIVVLAIIASTTVTNIFSVFLVADLFATCLVFPAFYKLKTKSTDLFLLFPFILSLLCVFIYRYLFVDLANNPGGVFIPTDLYGLADLNTFLVGFLTSMFITVAYNRISK
ncbi:MAG: hypothetical protein EVA29_01235 [Candidatus Actinomarinales bacterium]|nr:MAG: hypothetical protein EVA29_01235 [Candidatus Actinomarinales bacterium]